MANDFYERTFNPLPGQRVDEQVLKDEFQLIEQAFDEVEDEADTLAARAIKIPESSPDQTLAFSAVQRANLVLAFDASGNITAVSKGRWRGDWVTATDYVIGDSFRYAPTGNIYSTVEAHTSGVFATDLAANKFTLAVDVETVTVASAAAVAAAATATTQAGIATTGADTATAASDLSVAAALAAAASYDSFDDRYLGPKAADPTLDNDGNALLTGALYFNTTVVPNEMRVYDGSAWAAAYLPAAGYVTLVGTQTLTNKTIDSASNTLRIRQPRETRSTVTMLGLADHGKLLNITSGITQTVDAAATLGNGWWVELGSGDNTTPVVDPSGSETIDGALTLSLPPGWRYKLLCNGTNFTTEVIKRRPIYSLDKLVLVTANTNYIVPADTYVLRVYALGAGSVAVAATRTGASGGMAWGDIAVQPGDTVVFAISSGISTVTVNGVVMLTGNAAVTTTAGSASKHASVTNGGTSSGAGTTAGADTRAGPSSGSPLGSGVTGSSLGGIGWGGLGSSAGGGTGGAGSGARGGRAISAVSPSSEPLLSLLAGTPGSSSGTGDGGDGGPGAGGGSANGANVGGRGGLGAGGGYANSGTGGEGGFGASGGVGATVNGAAGYGAGGGLDAGGGIEAPGAAAFLYFNPV